MAEKIRELINIGGEMGAHWEKEKSILPENNPEQIKAESVKAEERIKSLQTENNTLSRLAQKLNRELEDTKLAVFFERTYRAMAEWQYFLLKLGYEQKRKKLKVGVALEKINDQFPELHRSLSLDNFMTTLDNLQELGFISAIRPYTKETPLKFNKITSQFLKYINQSSL